MGNPLRRYRSCLTKGQSRFRLRQSRLPHAKGGTCLSASLSLTRRQWVAGAAGATVLAGCATPPGKLAPVSILKAASYSEDLYALMQHLIVEHRLDVRGKRVVLKHNLVEFDQNTVINTHPKIDRKR